MAMMQWAVRAVLAVTIGVAAMFAPASAQESEKAFYAGKTVRMIVGSGTGGGYDIFSRMIAPYLAKTLGTDGHRREPARRRRPDRAQPPVHGDARRPADFAVQRHQRRLRAAHRRPGRALRPREVQLPRDRGRAARALAGRPEVAHPGSPAGGRGQDEMALGVVGCDLRARHRRRLHLRGAQARLPRGARLQGQRGRRPRGHARRDGRALRAGILRQQFRAVRTELGAGDDVPHQVALLPDRPTIFEAAKMDADQTWVMDFLANVEKLGRILVAPPGIPPARLAYLQEAVRVTLHNPQLIADGEKAERIIEYLDPRQHPWKRACRRVERGAGAEAARAEDPGGGEVARPAGRGTSCAPDCAPCCARAARRQIRRR